MLDTFGGGGKERRCLQLIQGLNKKGIMDIQVIIINNDIDYPEIFQTSSSIIIIDRKGKNLNNLSTIRQIKKLIDSYNPDIVQAWGLMSNFICCVIKPFRKYKLIGAYVADCVKPKSLISKFCNIMGNIFADRIIGNSFEGLRTYDVPKRKQVCIYNGYNKDRLQKLTEEESVSLRKDIGNEKKYLIAMIARVDSNKDYESYLKVANLVCGLRDDVDFFAIGDGRDFEQIKRIAAEEYGRCVKFLGRRNDVDSILEITTLTVLLSSLDFGEGVSNSILESMAHGVPTLATNKGGTPEIIEDGVNGFLINDNDVNQTAKLISHLLDNHILLEEMGKAALRTCENKFNLSTKTDEYYCLYQNLLKAK